MLPLLPLSARDRKGPGAAAVCAFSISDVKEAFDGLYKEVNRETQQWYTDVHPVPEPRPGAVSGFPLSSRSSSPPSSVRLLLRQTIKPEQNMRDFSGYKHTQIHTDMYRPFALTNRLFSEHWKLRRHRKRKLTKWWLLQHLQSKGLQFRRLATDTHLQWTPVSQATWNGVWETGRLAGPYS